jgi:molybdopterin converting factor small subunit
MTDITGNSHLSIKDVSDTDQLTNQLHDLYPAMKNSKYLIAVDKQIITENTLLEDNNTVAILPPYAGG